MSARELNLKRLEVVAKGIGSDLSSFTFVGGATTSLYIDDPAAPDVRSTMDVDCVVEVASRLAYARLEKSLRQKGFAHAPDDGVICRWEFNGVVVDVMPVDGSILGFTNHWYAQGIATRIPVNFGDVTLHIFNAQCFLASKFAAFASRGTGDWVASSDMEDIIAVMDGRLSLPEELGTIAAGALREYLAAQFTALLNHPSGEEILRAHLAPQPQSALRARRIKELMSKFVATLPGSQ